MTVFRLSALAAGVIGGAMAIGGAVSASAASLAPAVAHTADAAGVVQVTHDPRAWSYGQRWQQRRNFSGYNYGNRFRRSGPSVGFGLSVPGFGFGIGTPAPRAYSYGYRQPYGYGYGYGYPRYYGY